MVKQNKKFDLNKFVPVVQVAKTKIEDLIKSGAVIQSLTSTEVTLSRMGKTAKVDSYGRVSWIS